MPLGLFFWVIYIIAVLFGFWANYEAAQPLWYRRAGAYLILWLLVGVIGWQVFGAAIHK